MLGIEQGYPERFLIPEPLHEWELSHPLYFHAPIYARDNNIFDLLDEAGVEIRNSSELQVLGSLENKLAIEVFGPNVEKIRHPLGRTGINGTGLFYHAGEAQASDMAIVRQHTTRGFEVLLAYSRRWGLPGGFSEPGDEDGRQTAIREAVEETGIDVVDLRLEDDVITILPRMVKPNSRRSTDYGFITTQVEGLLLPEPGLGDAAKAGDDAKAVMWATQGTLDFLKREGNVSNDHYEYASKALAHFSPTE